MRGWEKMRGKASNWKKLREEKEKKNLGRNLKM